MTEVTEKPVKLVKVRLNMDSIIPTKELTINPKKVYLRGETIEVPAELAQEWTTETYQKIPSLMCERKGGDFLEDEFITRAQYL